MPPRVRAPAIVAMLLVAACRADLPHRWRHPALGFEMHSDFELVRTEFVFDADVRARIDALRRLFGQDDLDGLHVYVHDEATAQLGELRVSGWHGGDEIHVMAGYGGDLKAAMPVMASRETFLHELVHALVERAGLTLPRWYEEGLCEVLSASMLDAQGRLIWLPNVARERTARQLLGRDAWLDAAQLLSFVDCYPDRPERAAALYAEGTSFTWFLLRDEPPTDVAAIAAVAESPPEELQRRFVGWQRMVATGTVSDLMLPLSRHELARVRERAADGLDQDPASDGWWQAATRLLDDPDRDVRTTMRLRALVRPHDSDLAALRYADWSTSGRRQLRLAGLLALAQLGGLQAAQRFCRELTVDDHEWAQPLLWLVLIAPSEGGGRRALDSAMLMRPETMVAAARGLADDLEAMAPRLRFDQRARRYLLDE
ncbi:MAG: hypothetical protein ACE37K_07510 [Planctomycetota bacterium]